VLVTVFHGIMAFIAVLLSFALALYVAPDKERPWVWITPGSLLGTIVLLSASHGFRIYAQSWGSYSATYGSLAGIVVLMSWLWIGGLVLLVSAELNQVVEQASPQRRPGRIRGPRVDHRLER
jgi:membrane protein